MKFFPGLQCQRFYLPRCETAGEQLIYYTFQAASGARPGDDEAAVEKLVCNNRNSFKISMWVSHSISLTHSFPSSHSTNVISYVDVKCKLGNWIILLSQVENILPHFS